MLSNFLTAAYIISVWGSYRTIRYSVKRDTNGRWKNFDRCIGAGFSLIPGGNIFIAFIMFISGEDPPEWFNKDASW
jgi:hypothetical protein